MDETKRLYTDTQKAYYTSLKKRTLPLPAYALFQHLGPLLDFLQALSVFFHEQIYLLSMAGQSATRSLVKDFSFAEETHRKVRSQVLKLTSAKVNEYFAVAWSKGERGEVDLDSVLTPFVCMEDESMSRAVQVVDLLTRAMLQEDIMEKRPPAISFVSSLFSLPGMRTWILFAEAVKGDFSYSRKVFKQLSLVLNFLGIFPRFLSSKHPFFSFLDSEENPNDQTDHMSQELFRELGEGDYHKIPVPEDTAFTLNRLQAEILESRYPQDTSDFLGWFADNEDEFLREALSMWDNLEHPSRESGGVDVTHGLRPGGLDVIRVRVPALEKIGLRHIQLIPQRSVQQFAARFWIYHNDLDFRYYSTIILNAEKFVGGLHEVRAGLIFRYIALHSYWKIVTGQLFRRQNEKKRTVSPSVASEEGAHRKFLVRPHYRWLVPGYSASDRALMRSLQSFSHLPPEGKTFARSDQNAEEVVAGILPVNPSAKPIYTYTSEDLGYTETIES